MQLMMHTESFFFIYLNVICNLPLTIFQQLMRQAFLKCPPAPGIVLEQPGFTGFPGGSGGKESTCTIDLSSIPGLGRSPGGGHGNPLQYSCLENPHGQRSLVGYSPWGRKGSHMTERLSTAQHGLDSHRSEARPGSQGPGQGLCPTSKALFLPANHNLLSISPPLSLTHIPLDSVFL